MSKRKFKLISIVSIVLLALVILLNITATLAYFTDKKELTTPDLKFGNIKINANNEIGANSYFATNSLENIKPGDYVLNDDVKFSLDATSEPAYIRAKYKVSSPKSKNLFDINNLFENRNSDISVNGNVFVAKSKNSANCGFKFRVPTTIGKTYTISVKDISWDSTSFGLFIDSGNGQDHASYGTIKKTVKTITFTATTEYVYIQAYVCYALGSSPYTFSFEELQLEEGSTATAYQKYFDEVAETDLAGYLKYGNLIKGENLFSVDGRTRAVRNGDSEWANTSKRNITGHQYFVGLSSNNYFNNGLTDYSFDGNSIMVNAENYYCLGFDFLCSPNTTYTISFEGTSECRLTYFNENGEFLEYTNLLQKTYHSFTTPNNCTKMIIGFTRAVNNIIGTASNISLVKEPTNAYCWSEKIGDYYYLLDASTRQPLVVSDSSKTYTFISKENSKIADNYFSNLTSAGTSVNLSIGVEAIQVANLASSDTTKTTLELIKENLDNVNNVSSSGTYNIDFVVSGTTYLVSGVGYSEDATIPDSVITLLNSSSFGGFAFSENGYPVITKTSSGHSWIDITNKKLKNITEDLKLYAVDNSALETNYLVTFKNGTEILQATRVLNGKCEYLGDVPTKTATNEKEYVFAGWQIDGTGDIYTDLSNITISKDTTFVASFVERDRTFEIVYVLNGGGFKNEKIQTIKSTYTYGNAVTLPTADDMFKKDYTFDGWYETSNFSGNKVTTISATQSGNKTYYAKWKQN